MQPARFDPRQSGRHSGGMTAYPDRIVIGQVTIERPMAALHEMVRLLVSGEGIVNVLDEYISGTSYSDRKANSARASRLLSSRRQRAALGMELGEYLDRRFNEGGRNTTVPGTPASAEFTRLLYGVTATLTGSKLTNREATRVISGAQHISRGALKAKGALYKLEKELERHGGIQNLKKSGPDTVREVVDALSEVFPDLALWISRHPGPRGSIDHDGAGDMAEALDTYLVNEVNELLGVAGLSRSQEADTFGIVRTGAAPAGLARLGFGR